MDKKGENGSENPNLKKSISIVEMEVKDLERTINQMISDFIEKYEKNVLFIGCFPVRLTPSFSVSFTENDPIALKSLIEQMKSRSDYPKDA